MLLVFLSTSSTFESCSRLFYDIAHPLLWFSLTSFPPFPSSTDSLLTCYELRLDWHKSHKRHRSLAKVPIRKGIDLTAPHRCASDTRLISCFQQCEIQGGAPGFDAPTCRVADQVHNPPDITIRRMSRIGRPICSSLSPEGSNGSARSILSMSARNSKIVVCGFSRSHSKGFKIRGVPTRAVQLRIDL